jgi:DNA-binding MarR family transcriptional regulator
MNGKVLMGKLGSCFLTWRRWLAKSYARHGLTLKQAYLLEHADRAEYLFPADIAEMLYCDRPTATVIIRNLERDGLLERFRDPDNGKRFRIGITDAGRRKLGDLKGDPGRGENLFDPAACFTNEERELFNGLLVKLAGHLESLP